MVYPWYRAKPAVGTSVSQLTHHPKYLLISNSKTAGWHEFAMEWKEHIAWFTPILATGAAVVATRHWRLLLTDKNLRRIVLLMFSVCFFCAVIAGLMGALINKAAPIR